MSQSWQEQFGQIRALVHQAGGVRWTDDVLAMLTQMHDVDARRYAEEVLPYLDASLSEHPPVFEFEYKGYKQSFDALASIMEAVPFARLDLDVTIKNVVRLFNPEILYRVRRLTFRKHLTRRSEHRLVESSIYFNCLEELYLGGAKLSGDELFAFLNESTIQGLKRLEVVSSILTGDGLGLGSAIALSTLHELEYLDLNHSDLGRCGFEQLVQSSSMRHLKSLILYSSFFYEDQRYDTLDGAFTLMALETLDLGCNDLEDEFFEQLCTLPFSSLTTLNLMINELTCDSVDKLLDVDVFPALKTLNVCYNPIEIDTILQFKDAPTCPALEAVYVAEDILWEYEEEQVHEMGFEPFDDPDYETIWVLRCNTKG